jgi:hypothetical protein
MKINQLWGVDIPDYLRLLTYLGDSKACFDTPSVFLNKKQYNNEKIKLNRRLFPPFTPSQYFGTTAD